MNKVILTSIIITLTSIAVAAMNFHLKENFWMMPSRTWKVDKNFKNPNSHDFFSTPNFQSILSPRFSNVDYGPSLRTQLPTYNRVGVPNDPLFKRPMPPDPLDYNKHGLQSHNLSRPLDPHNPYSTSYANGNYNEVLNEIVQTGAVDGWPTSTVAESSLATFMNQDGEMTQPIIYDRYIYSNRNSRLRGLGDPIRGDLPIVPITGSWFIPSGAYEGPNIVLQQGAMNVMGGVNNETSNKLANLIYNSSGGAEKTIGGVDMAHINMSHNVYGSASAALGDVKMTAFP